MNIKRFFLNLGFLALFAATVISVDTAYKNSLVETVEGTVIETGISEYAFYTENGVSIPFIDAKTEYTVNGKTYYTTKHFRQNEEPETGTSVTVSYNRKTPGTIDYTDSYFMPVFIYIIGAAAVFFCRDALNGYKDEFIRRYPSAFSFTAVTVFVPVFYYIWLEYIFVPPEDIMFAGLGEGLIFLFLAFGVPAVNAVVWLIAIVCRHRRLKKAAEDKKI